MSEKKCSDCKYNLLYVNEEPCKTCMVKEYPEKKIKWEARAK